MTEKRKFLGELEIEESDDRFETVEALPNDLDNKVHHDRFSVKYESNAQLEVKSIAIQPFVDDSTPHGGMGVQLDPTKLDEFITALEMIRHQHLEV